MADLSAQELAEKLRGTPFKHTGLDVSKLTDPIADTPIVVTLDELRPYELNPRIMRNPSYDDIKASIRERGLEAPPPITRRPGAAHYIIRNGGNTRLSILRELWSETRDEKFFRIPCLFRPWSERGEIVALTGHLAENELRGALTFIERALGVEKARELYEQEAGEPLSQRELARRLKADGYPVSYSHISRMQAAVEHLLPVVPRVLYAGLGKPQIERLIALRNAAERCWERHVPKSRADDFSTLLHDVLSPFDGDPDTFDVQRMQDELVNQLCVRLELPYDQLALEFFDAETRESALAREPSASPSLQHPFRPAPNTATSLPAADVLPKPGAGSAPPLNEKIERPTASPTPPSAPIGRQAPSVPDTSLEERVQAHIVSPADTTERLQTIQRQVAEASGENTNDFKANVVRAIPVQAGGLHPISDVWYIEPGVDAPDRLRVHIDQLAREIAQEAGLAESIECVEDGVGFVCRRAGVRSSGTPPAFFARAVLSLLSALSAYAKGLPCAIDGVRLIDDLGPLLQGTWPMRAGAQPRRLSDEGFIKLFRLMRLVRRLVELESPADDRLTQ